MDWTTVGKNIRKYRLEKKWRQEDLAEQADLTPNYIGMIERGQKMPSLETVVVLANVLDVTADMLLSGVLKSGYTVENSLLNEKLQALSPAQRARIYAVIDVLITHAEA